MDRAWFKEREEHESSEPGLEPMDNIICQTIDRFYLNFHNSNLDIRYRYANIGYHTVDVKLQIMFLTDKPERKHAHRKIYRGKSHQRPRPKAQDRFFCEITANAFRSTVGGDWNAVDWLGKEWRKLNYKHRKDYACPYMNQIMDGILLEAKEDLQTTYGSKFSSTKERLRVAERNISKTWINLFNTANVQYTYIEGTKFIPFVDEQMTQKILSDPKHPITVMLLYCYSIQSFIHPIVNSAFKKRNHRKVFTMGPFATSLLSILHNASENRVDIDKSRFQNITMFRGLGLTLD